VKVTLQSDTMGPVVVPKEPSVVSNYTTRQSRPFDNSHGQLGAVSNQCHLIKARQALSQSYHSSTES